MTGPSPAPTDGNRPAGNRLGDETSPYLLQHKDNPVHWEPWGDEALARARREDKPIVLSVGYAACHWCHVMAHESFEDAGIARLMNENFVNIKVDREERPDLDAIYQSALHMMGEQGGWPLTMFLTPAGEPFWGGTYFPPTARYGRPGFPDVLQSVARVYKAEPERVQKNVTVLREGLAKLAEPAPGDGIPPGITDQIAERLAQLVDPFRGGIGGAPKFPQPGILEQLWRAWKRAPDDAAGEPFRRSVEVTLTNMCQGGIYDHLGGGFARYTVDERWLVPHFEKMLYDSAQLIDILTLVWQDTKSKLYARRVEETIGWMLREMVTEKGGFASSFDADSEGEEGKFYVWTEAEIDAVLGDDESAFFKPFYDVTPGGNWEGHTILNRLSRMQLATDDVEARLAASREKLLQVRAKRVPPGKDDKVLADWNGLAIAALAFAGDVFGRPDWIAAAARAFAFVRDDMTEEGRLRHSWREGALRHPATLDDYANLCRAALALYEATGEWSYIAQAEAWVAAVDAHYASPAGAYYFAADDTPDLITRAMTAADSAVPSGNGTLVGVFARLFHLTGKQSYRERAERIVAAFSGALAENFVPLSTLINNNELLQDALQIVLAGAPDAPDTEALRAAVNAVSLPNRILALLPPGADLPPDHPAAGKDPVGGKATAYVCRGTVCSAPLAAPDDLRAALAAR